MSCLPSVPPTPHCLGLKLWDGQEGRCQLHGPQPENHWSASKENSRAGDRGQGPAWGSTGREGGTGEPRLGFIARELLCAVVWALGVAIPRMVPCVAAPVTVSQCTSIVSL